MTGLSQVLLRCDCEEAAGAARRRADGVTQSSSVPPASFSPALKSPLTAVACGEENDIFLPRQEGVVGLQGAEAKRGGGRAV